MQAQLRQMQQFRIEIVVDEKCSEVMLGMQV